MKKISYLLLPLIGLSLSSCTTYASHYKAIILVTSQQTSEGSMRFGDFEGQYVFKLKKTTGGEGDIKYAASLMEGYVDVSYVDPVSKQELSLFSLDSGESVNSHGGYVEKGYKVIIIVKSEGNAHEGNFTFNIN